MTVSPYEALLSIKSKKTIAGRIAFANKTVMDSARTQKDIPDIKDRQLASIITPEQAQDS